MILLTDTCDTGWGLVLGTTPAAGIFPAEKHLEHINLKELQTIRLVLQSLEAQEAKSMLIKTDSQVILHVVRKMASRSPVLKRELRSLQYIFDYQVIHLQLEYIPSAFNLLADDMSRKISKDDWHVSKTVFSMAEKTFGTHPVDRFAAVHKVQFKDWGFRRGRSGRFPAIMRDRK